MSVLYDEDNSSWTVSKTINVNDCMKLSRKLSVNNEQIAKLIKVKEHTKTWIKNVEKASKIRNSLLHHPTVNYDMMVKAPVVSEPMDPLAAAVSPSMYPLVLPLTYACAFCRRPTVAGVVQYHDTLSHPYVLLCAVCSDGTR